MGFFVITKGMKTWQRFFLLYAFSVLKSFSTMYGSLVYSDRVSQLMIQWNETTIILGKVMTQSKSWNFAKMILW